MDPITAGLSSLLSMFGMQGLLGSTGAAAAAAPGATAGASGLGATMGGGATGLSAQMGAGTQLFAPQATAAMGASAAAPAYTDIAIKMGGLEGLKKAGTSLLDPNMSLHEKFNQAAPELYKQNQQGQATFAQLQQGSQPMQMPSYARPSMPYQGGGIEEILQRQRGLLR